MKKHYLTPSDGYIRIDEENKTFTSIFSTPESNLINFITNVQFVDRVISRISSVEPPIITEEVFNAKLEEVKLLLSAI